ncbi:YgjV family protein [uncultured Oscillibacter sp.]
MFGSPCTLLYDILVHTWGGAVCEAITILSIIISIVRFGWRNLGEESGVG